MSELILLKQHLPDLTDFLQRLVKDYQQGEFSGWHDFRDVCNEFYTEHMMQTIDASIPGWINMASYLNQKTLIHVTSALVSLLILDEYKQASPHQQALMEWIVLFHDIAKKPQHKKRDHIHGFGSAIITAKALPKLGFKTNDVYKSHYQTWSTVVSNATVYDETLQDHIQDNRKLPKIITGIDKMVTTDAGLIIKGVLFHMSLSGVDDWPNVAPLTDAEIKTYITPELYPLLRAMMLVDNDAHAFFNPATKSIHNQQTHREFQRVAKLIKLA